MKGQKMLKVCSVLQIVFSSIALAIMLLIALVGATLLSLIGFDAAAFGVLLIVIMFTGSILQFVAGIVGVKAAKTPSAGKIKAALVLGLIILALSLYSNISTLITSGFTAITVASCVGGLLIPVLYVLGLIQYKNALTELMGGGK